MPVTMSMIQFVQNYEDLSTDKGYQFKFHCDKCGNGFMTEFQTSAIGMAESALRVAGSVFGGFFNTAGNSAYEIQRAIGGPAHDSALAKAVEEGKTHFHQCTRCGKWVCPDVCWNADASMCDGCAPRFQQELASAHAHAKADAARQQLLAKAQKTDFVSDIEMSAQAVVRAPGTERRRREQVHGVRRRPGRRALLSAVWGGKARDGVLWLRSDPPARDALLRPVRDTRRLTHVRRQSRVNKQLCALVHSSSLRPRRPRRPSSQGTRGPWAPARSSSIHSKSSRAATSRE